MRYALQEVAKKLPPGKNRGWTANSLRRGGLQSTLLGQRQSAIQALGHREGKQLPLGKGGVRRPLRCGHRGTNRGRQGSGAGLESIAAAMQGFYQRQQQLSTNTTAATQQ